MSPYINISYGHFSWTILMGIHRRVMHVANEHDVSYFSMASCVGKVPLEVTYVKVREVGFLNRACEITSL